MVCPYCGTHIDDGAQVCPACHAELDLTQVMSRIDVSYCANCGAMLPAGADACPACGMPVAAGQPVSDPFGIAAEKGLEAERPANDPAPTEPAPPRHIRVLDLPDIGPDPKPDGDCPAAEIEPSAAEETNSMPRIESAIPSESRSAHSEDRLPRTKAVLAGALASLVLVGGSVLLISHPWDPNAYVTHNTTERDTSKAGFPGERDKLTGQDSSTEDSGAQISGDEQTLSDLSDAYEKLGKLAEKIDDNADTFDDVAFSGSLEQRKKGASTAKSLSYEVSNLIDDISGIDVTSGTYADDLGHLQTLGNWLRNRVDALNEAWQADVASDDPSSDRSGIEAPLKDAENANGTNTYKALFDQNYDAWKPAEKGSSD